jgi:glycosyltransferase involved in cell wall biosynthesis
VGRAAKVKNPEYLLGLKKELKKQKIDVGVFMVSEISKKNRLRKKLRKAGIKILPAMNIQQLRDFYRNMGIIISPSVFETYGNVPLESVASGTPALINNNMGVAEIFRRHHLDDYVLDFGDVPNVVRKIDGFRHDSVDRNIRESLRKYLWNTVIDEYYLCCRKEAALFHHMPQPGGNDGQEETDGSDTA